MKMLPTIFVSHGAPTLVLDKQAETSKFFRALGPQLTPRAILCVTAHWETHGGVRVSTAAHPEMIYDFHGFPEEMYRLDYPAPGAPEVARRAIALAAEHGIAVEADADRGFDHGVWTPLMAIFPEAEIPVVSMSVAVNRSAQWHIDLGRALMPLREEGVLIMGSGNATHNLRAVFSPGHRQALADPSRQFATWLAERIEAGDVAALADFERQAPFARENHPTPDHILPLFVPLGAAGPDAPGTVLHDDFVFDILSMAAYRWD